MMPARYDSDSDDDSEDRRDSDREISLGTGTVLGIFLALALVCSLFFGLGYSMGRRSSPAQAAVVAAPSSSSFDPGEKPSSGRTSALKESSARPDHQIAQPVDESSSASATDSPTENAAERAALPKPVGNERSPASKPSARQESAPAPAPQTAVVPGVQSFVQIAAVSRREDADLLLTALRTRGYSPVIRPQTLDKLLHIQVGPYATRKDAEAVRQRLISDGYNPILK